jgi:dienelactone hydrolase
MRHTTQHPIEPSVDLRDMLRQHLIERALACMERSTQRRKQALESGHTSDYQDFIRERTRLFYGQLPFGAGSPALQVTPVSRFEKQGYRIENVLFDSFPGWQVNASIYVPLDFAPPYPAVVIPVGHSGKQFESYQLPAQYFARSGYLAVLFDPPGQASERQTGNDHFIDGVRCYLTGQTSSRYFVADALRCVDYLYSRADVDTRHGVAMTGVSGGGMTTMLASVLDDRISVIGPSCCLASRADLDIVQAYAGCPETAMFGRYADFIDETDFLCAGAPKPTLLMAGAQDEVFRIDDTRTLANEVAAFFAGAPDKFVFYIDPGGHAYSLAQAREFTAFMDRWLRSESKANSEPNGAGFALDPYKEMRCYPRQDVNMRTLSLAAAKQLEGERGQFDPAKLGDFVRGRGKAHLHGEVVQATVGEPFRVWTHHWQQILLKPEPGIELPATFLYGSAQPTRAVLHFDDQHRDHLLNRHGPLTHAVGFLEGREEDSPYSLLSVDLRGWGDTQPALYPYELADWGGVDRFMAYISAALGDPLMAQRVRDGLASLDYLRSRPEVDPSQIVITGCGLGGLVALHVAALGTGVRGVVVWDALVSYRSLLETGKYTWPADTFWPNALVYYDIPELVAALPFSAVALNSRNGAGIGLTQAQIDLLNAQAGRNIYMREGDIVQTIKTSLGNRTISPGLPPG